MAITSFPFDGGAGATVSEANFSRFFRELRDSGVADDANTGTAFRVAAPGGTMTVSVAAGFALLRGHAVYSDSPVALSIGAAAGSTRIDRIVLRLDPTSNSITLQVIAGTPGAGAPAIQSTDTDLWDLPLATVTIAPGTAAVTSGMIADDRRFAGSDVGVWKSDSLRPPSPRFGRMGFNIAQSRWEYWNGSAWVAVASSVTWADITGKPSTFTPSSHGHAWGDISGAPSAYSPAAHSHDWASITGKPTSFTPSSHTHPYAATSHTHSGYAASSHSHGGGSITSAVSRANGTDRAHTNTPEGSTWYSVWVDGNRNFCRNTSSQKYKTNIRDHDIDPDKVLALQPRIYDRLGDDTPDDEFGLIAEEVQAQVPEIVTYFEGAVDGLRYDLLGVALLSVVKRQHAQIADLNGRLAILEGFL